MDALPLLLATTLSAGTVLAFAALGLLLNERAGVVNLGAEGMMLVAALAGFAAAVHTGSDWLGFAAGMAAGALLAAAFGLLVIWLTTNQYATGLALSLFGGGFSAFLGIGYTKETLPARPQHDLFGLGDLPLVGTALMRQHPLVSVYHHGMCWRVDGDGDRRRRHALRERHRLHHVDNVEFAKRRLWHARKT